MTRPQREQWIQRTRGLCRDMGVCFGFVVILSAFLLMAHSGIFGPAEKVASLDEVYAMDYSTGSIDGSAESGMIKYGYAIFRNTPDYLGPESANPFAGNGLACANCHLDAGTRPYAAPLIGVVQRFPQYRGRENKIGTIEERINGCMERSMNGRMMPEEGREMRAMVAYITWLGRYAPKDGNIEGKGFVTIDIPERPVDLEQGARIFQQHCMQCHGADGQGQKVAGSGKYLYPPLWGDDSYNNGAGMTRVITAAQFIKANMPFGTTYENPVLSDGEAYDVAGFINQQLRPDKARRGDDFPDLRKKPVSTPYGPYADPFPIRQHQVGPFQPIMDYYRHTHNIEKSK